jgi:DNA (cytosine-5)-methyltransferase 3A
MTAINKQNEDFDQLGYFGVKNACGVGGQSLRVYDINKKSTMGGIALYKTPQGIRRLTPIECERLQSLPDDYTNFLDSDVVRYKCLRNGFNVEVIKYILSFMQ